MEKSIGLGDIVSFSWKDGYADATVSCVHKDGTIDLFRPYTITSDFSCGNDSTSVICYVGIEECKKIDPKNLTLLRKGKTL